MREADRLALLGLIDKISDVEKAFNALSPSAREEFEAYALEFYKDLEASRKEAGIEKSMRSLFADPINSITSYIGSTRPDEIREKYPQTSGYSEVYRFKGSEFRYDFDHSVVEYGYFLTEDQLKEQVERVQEESGELIDEKEIPLLFGKPGWNSVSSASLWIENCYDMEARNEYLDGFVSDIKEDTYFLLKEFEDEMKKTSKKKPKAR